jgi:polyphosphate kinase
VILVGQEALDEKAEAWLDLQFREQIFPLLTPQAIDPAHPFPFIPNRGLSIIFELRRGKVTMRELIMLPAGVPRFIRIPGTQSRFITLEALIRRKTDYLFPEYEVVRGGAFRVLRDSDIEIEEEAEDLVRYFRTAIKRRRRGRVVRLEIEQDMPDVLVRFVKEGLDAANAIISESRASRSAFANMTATASPRSARRTSSSTIRTKASRSWWSSSGRRLQTRTSSRSSRPSTARASSRRSCARSSMRRKRASR